MYKGKAETLPHWISGKQQKISADVLIKENLMEYEKPFITFTKLETEGYDEDYYNLILHK